MALSFNIPGSIDIRISQFTNWQRYRGLEFIWQAALAIDVPDNPYSHIEVFVGRKTKHSRVVLLDAFLIENREIIAYVPEWINLIHYPEARMAE